VEIGKRKSAVGQGRGRAIEVTKGELEVGKDEGSCGIGLEKHEGVHKENEKWSVGDAELGRIH
jgi:hypothetical protein